jgi:hypothetical protein
MAESEFQDTIINEIGELKKVVVDMKQEIDFIKDRFEDRILSDDDKKAIDETLEAEKAGKLKSMDEVFD